MKALIEVKKLFWVEFHEKSLKVWNFQLLSTFKIRLQFQTFWLSESYSRVLKTWENTVWALGKKIRRTDGGGGVESRIYFLKFFKERNFRKKNIPRCSTDTNVDVSTFRRERVETRNECSKKIFRECWGINVEILFFSESGLCARWKRPIFTPSCSPCSIS